MNLEIMMYKLCKNYLVKLPKIPLIYISFL